VHLVDVIKDVYDNMEYFKTH